MHVRMPRATITPHLHPLPHLHPFGEMASGFGSFHPPSHPRRDHAPCSQVTCDSPSNPAHHARPLVSALPPREAARSTATLHRKRCPLTPQRAEARTTCELRVTVTPAPSCKGHSTSYRSLRASRVTDCARATAMVVKRKTRNEGNTHHTPVVPRVQPLLKCAPSCCVRTESLMDERPAATTLNVACSWTAPITTVSHSSSSISSSQSHSSSSQLSHSLCFDPTQGGGWPHTAVQQDCRKVTHTSLVTMRPPASSCQLRRGCNSSTPLNPFRRAGFTHVTQGVHG